MVFSWFKEKQPVVKTLINRHMGGLCQSAETVTHTIKSAERIVIQMTLDSWLARGGQLIGYAPDNFHSNTNLSQLLLDEVRIAPVQRRQFEKAPGEFIDCVTRGLLLLHHEGQPFVVLLSQPDSRYDTPALEIMAGDRATATAVLNKLQEAITKDTIYKGRTIYLEEDRFGGDIIIRFQQMPPASRDALVLPEAIMTVVERNVIGMIKHAETLRQSGRSTRHGVLLHGPPGTGKTLLLRYLAASLPSHTVILMTGRQEGLVRESCQLAKILAPALVILEDVDLIATSRETNRCPVLLHDLMDEMDGLGTKAEVIFLLTTNRPEELESALSARPGRIDQAIEFPLPDDDCRLRLFRLYGKGLDLSAVNLEQWVARTENVSPAFIEELLRKSALMAAERGENEVPLKLKDGDIQLALEELVIFGGELTQKLLGFKP
ncbi:MAG: 26S protease regulatory subunit, partial [Planctomycetia bacterium]|nr:26S protease regulatory subunit [Planctomycetia bacterium]